MPVVMIYACTIRCKPMGQMCISPARFLGLIRLCTMPSPSPYFPVLARTKWYFLCFSPEEQCHGNAFWLHPSDPKGTMRWQEMVSSLQGKEVSSDSWDFFYMLFSCGDTSTITVLHQLMEMGSHHPQASKLRKQRKTPASGTQFGHF